MALNFNSVGSNRKVDCGSAASLDDLGAGPLTVWAWVYRETDGADQYIVSKAVGGAGWTLACVNGGGEGQVSFVNYRSTTNTVYESASAAIPLNTWTFVVATFDDSLSPEVDIYTGGLSTAAAEVSYSSTQDGAGTFPSDAAYPLEFGNVTSAANFPFLGRIARGGVITRRLTLEEIITLQFASIGQANIANTKVLVDLHGTGTQPDLSGNGNNGTVTGATAAAHVPLRNDFGSTNVRAFQSAYSNQIFTVTGTWQAPAGVTSVQAECWAGGGGGGGATGNPAGGGGGAGGCYVIKQVTVVPGTTYTVTVGAAGTGTTGSGGVGGDSWFNTTGTVIAKGGAGGILNNGAGGTGSTTGCIGDTSYAGGNGVAGTTTLGGAGGGGAGTTGAGGNGSGATAGTGTSGGGGSGGAGLSVTNVGNAGLVYGGGGGGGLATTNTDRTGGAGGAGKVILTWLPASGSLRDVIGIGVVPWVR